MEVVQQLIQGTACNLVVYQPPINYILLVKDLILK